MGEGDLPFFLLSVQAPRAAVAIIRSFFDVLVAQACLLGHSGSTRRTSEAEGLEMQRSHSVTSILRLLTAIAIALASVLTPVVIAVGKDEALYLGGTLREFPPGSKPRNVTGRLNTSSASDLVFEAGRAGSLAIPYSAIVSLEYGLDPGRRGQAPKARLLLIPWDVTDQFTANPHYLLTLVYQDSSGIEQTVIFELGQNLPRVTLETLERHTRKKVDFQNVEVCSRFRSSDECGYGKPAELKGLKSVALDSRISTEHRERILAELEKDGGGLTVVDSTEAAEIVLTFRSVQSQYAECPCEGGRGEAALAGNRPRVVLVFVDRKKGIWGRSPAANFGRAFIEAFRDANR